MDKLEDLIQLNKLKTNFPDAVFISAEKELRIQNLLDEIIKKATEGNIIKDILIPYDQSALLDQIYSQFNVISRKETDYGFEFKVSGKSDRIEKLLGIVG